MKSSRKELTIKEIDELLKNYSSVLSNEDVLKLVMLQENKSSLRKHVIYENCKFTLAFAILIAQFSIMWSRGWYILFFVLLIFILTDLFFGRKIKNYFSQKIKEHILKKYDFDSWSAK
ncbi:MAG: hypothetical protein K6B70_01385 [Clostridia bacterium]|nr:hypothetical protein [Clostridia bacterium]